MLQEKSKELSSQSKRFHKQSKPGVLSSMFGGIASSISSLFSSKKTSAPISTSSQFLSEDLPTETFRGLPSSPKLSSTNASSYLDVVTKQRFEGCWHHTDQGLFSLVLKDNTLSNPPSQLKTDSGVPIETIWMTVLVLLWLETVCQSDKKAWSLIYQKGYEWLKEQGIDYEGCKDLGKPYIKA